MSVELRGRISWRSSQIDCDWLYPSLCPLMIFGMLGLGMSGWRLDGPIASPRLVFLADEERRSSYPSHTRHKPAGISDRRKNSSSRVRGRGARGVIAVI